MRPEQTERLAELVEAALECNPPDRPRFVAASCGNDDELRAEVESLLRHENQARKFIETPAYAQAAETLLEATDKLIAGQLLESYRIVSLLGEGGMGEVYLAQDTALGRRVAIKLVKRGFGGASIVRHFRNEERILASLNHPNIARLYGGGITPDGVLYFVMELVEGERIDDYCRNNNLSIGQRLELFRKVCAAVSYAHQHLVIHRDLKPANIRVTPEGEPKLLDFGIAKLLDPETTATAEQTITFQALMTPDYASPEQLRGEMMTTTSDVYSLGVVLYQLLTGERPYRVKTRRADEIARAIDQQEPARPSTAAGKGDKAGLPDQRLLRSDVDNIVLKALRKEPERRYASAGQLSEDIRRYLAGLPVIARKDTVAYRARKFVRRHRFGVAAAALVFLSLAGGIVATNYEARRAQRRFNDVRDLAHSLMFEVHDAVQDLQGSTPARRLIVQRALQYLDALNVEGGFDPSLQRELATAYEKVGDIQGNPYNANLGDTKGALNSYRKATALRERVGRRETTPQAAIERARSYRGVGDIMQMTGDIAGSLKDYRYSLSILQGLATTRRGDRDLLDELARAYDVLGDALGRTNQSAERLGDYKQAGAKATSENNFRLSGPSGACAARPLLPRRRGAEGSASWKLALPFSPRARPQG